MIKQIVYLVFQLLIVTVLCGNDSLGSLFANLFADLVNALFVKVAGVRFSGALPSSNAFLRSFNTSNIS